ncbi:hypothetical protein BKA67DRAFT_543801 [Truncatella angustata]|uniref:Uncharacterized protein n=1 Tax=Truncatella angustata TaxID=152316 RepID=A0A9P8UVN9_9PEZI|nr:uncharacterized protein BKA67DRAFT_543801 [Truncatella angustata]KAH6659185.1 hypothetical protein BKA67DRAFT_543801 [Truncatella angustata]KAH8204862.1 hypothetical protein TruAng_000901 [Truncatella angustata]
MPADNEAFTHPTPRQAFDLARKHAELLRHLFNHPQYVYSSPPTAARYPTDTSRTPVALLMVTDFVQTTYVEHVLPFLPPGASRRVREVGNPWAYADAGHVWEWEWDEEKGEIRDKRDGAVQEFPSLGDAKGTEMRGDVWSRAFMAGKCICENGTDPKAKLMIGGQSFDFGEDARRIITSLQEL